MSTHAQSPEIEDGSSLNGPERRVKEKRLRKQECALSLAGRRSQPGGVGRRFCRIFLCIRPVEPSQRVDTPAPKRVKSRTLGTHGGEVRLRVRWPKAMSGHLTGFPRKIRGFFTWPWSIWPSEALGQDREPYEGK